MCKVHRIKMPCGHTNDHVLMICNTGKDKNAPRATTGYDATTDPYCAGSTPKVLTDPTGYKCMVEGCSGKSRLNIFALFGVAPIF
ncbi:hypothetical protein FQN54_008492 [Arachnomyces sp. PD_36]|nr:hypothetical protein FQN54_008492 [Arachnomyces sp. PD_36]